MELHSALLNRVRVACVVAALAAPAKIVAADAVPMADHEKLAILYEVFSEHEQSLPVQIDPNTTVTDMSLGQGVAMYRMQVQGLNIAPEHMPILAERLQQIAMQSCSNAFTAALMDLGYTITKSYWWPDEDAPRVVTKVSKDRCLGPPA